MMGALVAASFLPMFRQAEPLHPAELKLTTEARQLVTNGGRDAAGRLLPLFVEGSNQEWLPPNPVYPLALIETGGPQSPSTIRWVSSLFGAANVALIYLVATRMTRSPLCGFIAGLLLLTSPAHAKYSQMVTPDGIWLLPFAIFWVFVILRVIDSGPSRSTWLLGGGAAMLTMGIYAERSALFVLASFGAVGVLLLYRAGRLGGAAFAAACAGAACAFAPALMMFIRVPAAYGNTLGAWVISPAYPFNPVAALRDGSINWFSLAASAAVYWDFFSPAHLFASSTAPAFAAVFLTGLAPLMLVGMHRAFSSSDSDVRRRTIALLLVLLFVVSPVAAAVLKEPRAIQRGLVIVPIGVLLATLGMQEMWRRRTGWHRWFIASCLVAALTQFLYQLA